ncbi:HNH endonuclease [Halococcoides cellulosivorans]|uniref:HNH endonuclease n=1 Tax=Halococcoides cellulosivorans TaxID=1679096 RepID=A0A2R4X4D0_9EURY|nr:HNH endonuclease [Halococcoides cellulosivorans]
MERDQFTCQSCGLKSTRIERVPFDIDHIVPKSEGGTHALENLQTLCPVCHAEKHPDVDRLQRRARQFRQRNRPSTLFRAIAVLTVLPALLGLHRPAGTLDRYGRRIAVDRVEHAVGSAEGSDVTVEVMPTELWTADDASVQQLGRLRDLNGTGSTVRFVAWAGNDLPRMERDHQYRLFGARVDTYEGHDQLVLDSLTDIEQL